MVCETEDVLLSASGPTYSGPVIFAHYPQGVQGRIQWCALDLLKEAAIAAPGAVPSVGFSGCGYVRKVQW